MKNQFRSLAVFAVAAAAGMSFGAGEAQAQGGPPRGNFDPQQMRQRLMADVRQQMEVKDESEWKAISNRIYRVMEAGRSMSGGPGGGFMGPPGAPPETSGSGGSPDRQGPGPGGPPPPGNDGSGPPGGPEGPNGGRGGPGGPDDSFGAPPAGGPGGPAGPGGFNREANPELDALRRAIQNKASNAELKADLARVREARERKKIEFEKKRLAYEAAQEDLRQVLSVRQEAIAAAMGLL